MSRLNKEYAGRIVSSKINKSGVWQIGGSPLDTQDFITASGQTSNLSTGTVTVKPEDYSGDPFETYLENSLYGGGWLLAWVVTNTAGDLADWFNGDFGSGTNHFTSISQLNMSSMTSLNKQNAKNPIFDYWPFQEMMVREDHAETIGTKAYSMTGTASFRTRLQAANDVAYTDRVASIIGSTGSFYTFTTNTLAFNYNLSNDGARVATTPATLEAVGGISSRVDGGTSYGWKGNITRADSGRSYGADGTTTDHTIWFFVR